MSRASAHVSVAPALGAPTAAVARVGPNAVIQLAHALAALESIEARDAIFTKAGAAHLLLDPPTELVAEQVPARLFDSVWHTLPRERAHAVLRDAGTRTGAYILAHRIPNPVKIVLRRLPAPVASRLLLVAITRHAWTFAGSGTVTCTYGRQVTLEISSNPLATPGCPWHAAVIEALFRDLAGSARRVHHDTCCARGDMACRFVVT